MNPWMNMNTPPLALIMSAESVCMCDSRVCCCMAPLARVRPCWPGRWPTTQTAPSSGCLAVSWCRSTLGRAAVWSESSLSWPGDPHVCQNTNDFTLCKRLPDNNNQVCTTVFAHMPTQGACTRHHVDGWDEQHRQRWWRWLSYLTQNIHVPCTLLPDNSCFVRIAVITRVHQYLHVYSSNYVCTMGMQGTCTQHHLHGWSRQHWQC